MQIVDTATKSFWDQIKSKLKSKNSDNKLLQTWFEPTELIGIDDSPRGRKFHLGVPTDLHKYWISENLFDRICSEISSIYASPFEVDLVVTNQQIHVEPENPHALQQALSQIESHPEQNRPYQPEDKTTKASFLYPEYTFNNFVVGRNNEFAHAASFTVAKDPGARGYNPLFIVGPTGMGKTHLLHAVGNWIRESSPHLRVFCLSTDRLITELLQALSHKEMDKFKLRYRERCDILLLDDIHQLKRGEFVQEEFFNILNDFFEKGKQVVVTCDRMPKDIVGLEDRIRTRLEWGLIADIQMPDLETRVAILRYKSEQMKLRLSEEVVYYIARISKRSIRELEGNLNKVKMYTEFRGLEINLEESKKMFVQHDSFSTLTLEDIQKMVSDHFRVKLVDLKSKSRAKPFVTARQVAMYLIKKNLDKSLVQIGESFGGKDHTTVINAISRIKDQQEKNIELKRDIEELQSRIHNITGL